MTCGSTTGVINFFVRGLPKTQGSTRTWVVKGKPITTTTTKGLYDWRRLIADQAQGHAPKSPWDAAVIMWATFYLPRPKSESKKVRTYPSRRPDLSKLLRAVEDALTHIFWTDDSRIVMAHITKQWADDPSVDEKDRRPPGVYIEAWPIGAFPLHVKTYGVNVLDEVRTKGY